MKAHETTLRVRYAETDAMRVVYYGNYFTYFEVGRCELVRQLGVSYAEWERREGIYLAVVEASCRYSAPARYDDLLTVRTTLEQVRSRSLIFRYEIVQADTGKLIAEGRTAHVCVNGEGRPVEIPASLRTMLEG